MNPLASYRQRAQMLWGALLVIGGCLYLFDRLDMFDLISWWHYWPLLLVVFGLNKLLPPSSPKLIVSGLWEIFFAVWFFLCYEEIWGLTFWNSWPLLTIACGLAMILQPLLSKSLGTQEGMQHEKQ